MYGWTRYINSLQRVTFHQIFVQLAGDSQPADECESGDIFVAVVHFDQLTLEEADVHLETVGKSHLDEKEVVIVLLELLVGGVLREEQLGKILEVADRSWRKRVEPIESYFLQTGREDPALDGIAPGMYHYLILILAEMRDQNSLTRVVVKGWNRELLEKFTFQ